MTLRLLVLSTVSLLLAAPSALADEPAPADSPALAPDAAPLPATSAEGPETAATRARRRDASIDRGFTTGHAETIGKGQWTFNSYELFLAGLTYGITDDVQLAFTTLLPIVSDIPLLIGLSPKVVLSRGARHVVAMRGNVFVGHESGAVGGIASAGPYVDYYLDPRGRFALHGGLTVGGIFGGTVGSDFGFGQGLLLTIDAGFSAAVKRNLKFIVETQVFGVASRSGFILADTTILNYGLRFHGPDLAVDLAFLRPLGADTGPLVMGVPYVTFSARF